MADTLKRLAGPTLLPTGETTLYTVPGGTTATILSIHVGNNDSVARTLKLGIGADAAGTRFVPNTSIDPTESYDWDGKLVMAAGETLRATPSANNVLTATVSGVEST